MGTPDTPATDRTRLLTALAAVTALYFLAGRLGLTFAYVNASVTAIWPPAGIAVAALLVIGLRAWPAVALGAFLTNVTLTAAIGPSVAIAAGNTLECVAAAVLTRRFARGRFAFERGADLLRFAALAGLVAPTIAATVGTATLRLSGLASAADTMKVWSTWWLGDATGIALLTPLCVLWTVRQPPVLARPAERLALAASVTVLLFVVVNASATVLRDLPLAALMLPLLLWSAFRFNARTTSVLSVVMSGIAIYRVLHELGPFHLGKPAMALLIAQTVVAIVSLLILSVAAEVGTRARSESDARLLNDTLERRVLERTRELTRVRDRLAQAQAVAHVGSWEWDVATDSVWWSDELCRIFGITQAPAGYQGFLALLHPDDRDRTDAAVRDTMRTGRPFALDHRIVKTDGGIRMLHARGSLEVDASGRPLRLVGIGHDITERHQAEESRAQLIRQEARLRDAEGANVAKDAFLATLSHELRTPLNAALGWAHILRGSQQADGRDDRAVQAIYRNLVIQSHLVSDILDVSRIVKGELPIDRAIVDMASVFEAASEMVREAATARGVTVDAHSAGPTTVLGDARRLEQVAWNLLANAVKFAKEGGRVTVSVVADPDAVECIVEDDGPGIAPDFMPHMFEHFRQADSSATREHGGLGLGLAIASEIVRRHQGTISAANRMNGGARLVVRLPRWGTHPPAVETRRSTEL